MTASTDFYGRVLGASRVQGTGKDGEVRFAFSPAQYVEVIPLPVQHGDSRLGCVAFVTADAAGLRSYLAAHGVTDSGAVQTDTDGSRWFTVKDPEGNRVEFVQGGREPVAVDTRPISTRIIHVGYAVHSRSAEDRFYREVLGFRPYWYGAMQSGKVDWVSLQVPEGHDWMEYMMVDEGSDTPGPNVTARQLGVMNHFSLGVRNMEQAMTTLIGEDRVSTRHDGPQMGRDGKWQANLYDPDGTRVELMEFAPVVKPCCSAFTAESPVR